MISKKNKSFLLTIAILISSSFLSVSAQQSELEEILKPLDASLANAALVPWTQIEKEFMR